MICANQLVQLLVSWCATVDMCCYTRHCCTILQLITLLRLQAAVAVEAPAEVPSKAALEGDMEATMRYQKPDQRWVLRLLPPPKWTSN